MSKAKSETTTPQALEQQIEILSDQKSDEFIEALAAETRRKISEKLVNGAFVQAVFGGESGVNFTALPSFGGSLSLPETVEATAK